MRRLFIAALLLAALLSLPACGAEGPETPEPPKSPSPDLLPEKTGLFAGTEEGSLTVYACGGLQIALPTRYLDQLLLSDDPAVTSVAREEYLLTVWERASVEAAEAEIDGPAGLGRLFSIGWVDQAGLEQLLSIDYPGVCLFARDDSRYYFCVTPTDVQFYRPGGQFDVSEEEQENWKTLNAIALEVQEDMIARNGLTAYSTQAFLEQPYTWEGAHQSLEYRPDFLSGGACRLVLSQPARQGEGGLWCVERWYDEAGILHLYFPDSGGRPAAETYQSLQAQCDAGERPELLTPLGAAQEFAALYFGRPAQEKDFQVLEE